LAKFITQTSFSTPLHLKQIINIKTALCGKTPEKCATGFYQ